MAILKLILISVIFEKIKSQCLPITCGISTSLDGVCFQETSNGQNYQYNPCLYNQYCNYSTPNSFSLFPLTDNNTLSTLTNNKNFMCNSAKITMYSGVYPGVQYDFCMTNIDCASQNCTNNICYGLIPGSNCNSTTQCDANSYCNNMCLPRKTYDSSCLYDYECYNDAGCLNKTCTRTHSLPNGVFWGTSNLTEGNFYCQSGYGGPTGICEDLLNTGTYPYDCNITNNGICFYRSSITNIKIQKLNCACSAFDSTMSRCPLGTKTSQYKNFLNAWDLNLNSGCHFYNKNWCNITNIANLALINTLNATWNQINQYNTKNINTGSNGCFGTIDQVFTLYKNPAIYCPSGFCGISSIIQVKIFFLFILMLLTIF